MPANVFGVVKFGTRQPVVTLAGSALGRIVGGGHIKRLARRLLFFLLAKLLRRRIVKLARRWLARRVRRASLNMARAMVRRGARGMARGAASVLGRGPLCHTPMGEGPILRLSALAEALDDRSARNGTA